jgi:serine/threonine protein kinase/predicted Zn-dependent peptidase
MVSDDSNDPVHDGHASTLIQEHLAETAPAQHQDEPSEGVGVTESIGRFRVVGELGRGGMGVVYRAHDPVLGRDVALKLLSYHGTRDEPAHRRLHREAQAMARMAHPNVVHVYEVGEHDQQVFLVMERIEGQTLREWLATETRSWQDSLALLLQAGEGLAAAHQVGLVHRDFKPDNVLVDRAGRARVVDFGLARSGGTFIEGTDVERGDRSPSVSELESLTATGAIAGTPSYMAPEQFRGESTDGRTDQFAFCVTLFEAWYGRRPFEERSFDALMTAVVSASMVEIEPERHGIPSRLHEVVLRGLGAAPEDRFSSMRALLDALRKESRQRARSRTWSLAGLAGLAAASALLGAALWRIDSPDRVGDVHEETDSVTGDDVITSAALAASELPDPLPTPLAEDFAGVTIHRLANGLTLYVCPRRDVPRIAAQLVIRVGSAYDPPDAKGAAHILARVTRHGTARLGTIDWAAEKPHRDAILAMLDGATTSDEGWHSEDTLDRLSALEHSAAAFVVPEEHQSVLRELGIESGTEVFREYTSIWADLPSSRLEAWSRLEAERLRRTVFRGFLEEVADTINRIDDPRPGHDTADHVLELAMQGLYAGTPYGHDPRGELEDLGRLSLPAVRRLHEQWYVPNNIAIVLVGDVDAQMAVPLLEQSFGDWAARALPERPRRPEGAGPPDATVQHHGGLGAFGLAWRLPPPSDGPAHAAATLAASALTEGVNHGGRDEGVLMLERVGSHAAVVAVVGASGPQWRSWSTTFLPPIWPGRTSDEERLSGFMDLVQATTESPLELESSSNRLGGYRRFEAESDDVFARRIARAYGERMAWSAFVSQTAGSGLSQDAVSELWQAMGANPSWLMTGGVTPRRSPPLPPLPVLRGERRGPSPFVEDLLALPHSQSEPQFIVEGRHYWVREGPGGVAVAARCERGVEHLSVDYDLEGLPTSTSCATFMAAAHAQAAEIGASSAEPGPRTLTVQCSGSRGTLRLVTDEAASLEPWLRAPEQWFPAEENARHLEAALALTSRGWVASQVGDATLPNVVQSYVAHGVQRPLRSFSSDRIGTDDVVRTWPLVSSRPITVRYCGARPREALELAPIDRPRTGGEARGRFATREDEGQHVYVFDILRAKRATAFVNVPLAETEAAPSAAIALLLERHLAARLHDRVFGELASVELHVNVVRARERGERSGLVLAVTAPPETIVPAIARVIATMSDSDISQDDLERAREGVESSIRTTRIPAREIPETVLEWRRQGASSDPRMEAWATLASVRREDLVDLTRRIREGAVIVALAGPLDAIRREDLATLGTVHELVRQDLE